jgi:Protein of unknown function (DUF2795)
VQAQTAELQVLLEGVSLPASKDELVRYAREQQDAEGAVRLLERLPEREFRTLDEVGEMLAPVQSYWSYVAPLPHEESDLPPGGDDYVNPSPVPGGVRPDAPSGNPPQKAIEKQTKTQTEQQERQKEKLES